MQHQLTFYSGFFVDKRKAPKKENKHRAMDDIKESIKELKFYKDNIFKAPNRSRH